MEGFFDKIAVKPGDVLFIPGGVPHAVGNGIFMVEIMEPSVLVVRFEFESAGCHAPEPARHNPCPVLEVWREHTVEAGQVEPWPGNQRSQACHKVQRFQHHVGRAHPETGYCEGGSNNSLGHRNG